MACHIPPNVPPVADVDVVGTCFLVGESITFDGGDSYDVEDTNITKWHWSITPGTGYVIDSGGGLNDSTMAVTFNTAGSYTVTLEVEDSQGAKSNPDASVSVTVVDLDSVISDPGVDALDVSTNTLLDWIGGADSSSHDVYLAAGTDPSVVDTADYLDSAYQGNFLPTTFDPTVLDFSTDYYWRVDELGSNAPQWLNHAVTGALDLDGAGYVDIPYNILDPSASSFSAFAWIKTSASDVKILQQRDGTGTGRTWLYLDGSGYLATYIGGSGISTATALNDGLWHHVGLVWNGGVGVYTRSLYVDGILVKSDVLGANVESTTDGTMYIGTNKQATGNFFNGLINDVRIYDIDLSADKVAYVRGVSDATDPTTTNLVAHWKMDDTGTTATDSANTNDGTLQNNAVSFRQA